MSETIFSVLCTARGDMVEVFCAEFESRDQAENYVKHMLAEFKRVKAPTPFEFDIAEIR